MRYNYNLIGLSKVDGITLFEGKGVNELTAEVNVGLANEGLFTKLTRALAGHEKASDADKKAIVQAGWDVLFSGKLRSGKKAGQTAEQKAEAAKQAAILTMRKAVEHGSKEEKKMVESIIAKM
jgi:hypothetical protein